MFGWAEYPGGEGLGVPRYVTEDRAGCHNAATRKCATSAKKH